jgi:hypothetical protein
MNVYLLDALIPLHHDSRNLFTLRWDLHLGQFDQAQFVIVPKSHKLVVHFLGISQESAQQYHNVIFEHNHSLSHELLYARFAWALMKIVKSSQLDSKLFKFVGASEDRKQGKRDGNTGDLGTGGAGGHVGGKRKRNNDGDGDDSDGISDDGDHGDTSATYHPRLTPGHQPPDVLSLQSNAWLSDMLLNVAPGNQSSLDTDTQEIEEDLRTAALTLPFFGGCVLHGCESVLMTSITIQLIQL